jgi:hypothetical protein
MTTRFGKLIEDARCREPEPEPPAALVDPVVAAPIVAQPSPSPAPVKPSPALPKRGRPPGKKSKIGRGDRVGEFSQVTAYVTTATRVRVDIALRQEALKQGTKRREFSELVQELLDAWLDSRG